MPVNKKIQPKNSLLEFGLALKKVRERKGISLDEISLTTKIPASMFVALERGDLSHWPKGIFGREFFRAYAGMLGILEDEACKEFVRLFPNEIGPEPTSSPAAGEAARATHPPDKPPSLLDKIAKLFRKQEATAVQPDKDKEKGKREWTSDAQRVGPPPSSRMRVRIKMG